MLCREKLNKRIKHFQWEKIGVCLRLFSEKFIFNWTYLNVYTITNEPPHGVDALLFYFTMNPTVRTLHTRARAHPDIRTNSINWSLGEFCYYAILRTVCGCFTHQTEALHS